MTEPFDIFRRDGESVLWIEAANDLPAAKKRLREIGARSPGKYLIVSQPTGSKVWFDVEADGTMRHGSTLQ